MLIHEPVQAAIWHCLNHYAYADAAFLAERLYYEVGSDEALYLLATCYFRSGKPIRAYGLLQKAGCPTPQCKYLLAHCCMAINKLSEAEMALTGHILLKNKQLDDIAEEFGDSACFTLQLLGQIYSKTERTAKASECFHKSLKHNPFLWSSFEALCKLGEKPDPSKTFQVHSETFSNACPTSNLNSSVVSCELLQDSHVSECQDTPLAMLNTPQIITPTGGMSLLQTNAPPLPVRERFRQTKAIRKLHDSVNLPSPPSFGVLPFDSTPNPSGQMTSTPIFPVMENTPSPGIPDMLPRVPTKKPMTRRSQQQGNSSGSNKPPPLFTQSSCNTNAGRDTPTSQTLQGGHGPALRRSSRLFSNASSSVKENNKSQRKFPGPKAPVKKNKSKSGKTPQEMNEINKGLELGGVTEIKPSPTVDSTEQMVAMQKHSAEGLMQLMQMMGRAYVALCQYDCAKALQLFHAVPPRHFNTGWVLCQVGRAHLEMADYQKAEKAFSEVRACDPCQLDGMETYSTTLWHLQREVQLSALAQELTNLDKESPQSWCVAGNCFSLQKEHDVAIKFFQRAVQVDTNFAYAYTLLGHEYVLTEELDKALACYRNAIRVDPRHYNAWYGVGMVYYKQEKFSLAEVHFRRALSINTQSSVLLCHIGVVQHALKKSDSALATLNKAIVTDPKNELCKFHRASILFANDRHKEALAELEELKEIVPRESLVYFLIGKVHKKLGNTHLALMNFSWAMDLDPKGANNQIKEAIDKRYVNEEDDPNLSGLVEPAALLAEDEEEEEEEEERMSHNSSVMDAEEVHLQAIESDESL